MPRRLRAAVGGVLYHVLNRAVGRSRIFKKAADYLAFEKVMEEVHRRIPMRLLSYCLMPNHFHLVPWPREDGELSEYMRLLTVTHTQRWHAHHHTAGTGPVYQGRFKSFPIQRDEHLIAVCRYVERNAKRSGLVRHAAEWRWCSLNRRRECPPWLMKMEDWPVDVAKGWERFVDEAQTEAEVEAIEISLRRGRPFGTEIWTARTAKMLDLESTLRPRGRQRVRPIKDSRPL